MVSIKTNKSPGNAGNIKHLPLTVEPNEIKTSINWARDRKTDLSHLKKETEHYLKLVRISKIWEKKQAKHILIQFQGLVQGELPKMVEAINQLEGILSVKDFSQGGFSIQKLSSIQKQWSDFKGKYVATKFNLLEAITRCYPVVII